MAKDKTTVYSPGDFEGSADTHLNALRAGPNFQGLPESEITPGYVEEALSETNFQVQVAKGLQLQFANNFVS